MPTHPDKNGYPLPVPVDDGSRLCVVVRVPNIPGHRQAFIGAVAELTHAYNWGNDSAHTALEVAYLWKNIFDEMMEHFYDEECGDMPVRCCVPNISITIIKRINPDTGRPEVSDDDGAHWYPDPDDPALLIRSLPPPIASGVSATKCDAATNGFEHIVSLISGTKANLDEALNVFDLAVSIAGLALEIALVIITGGAAAWALTPQILALVGLIWAGARALFEFGSAAFEAYWDDAEKDKILCALVCTIGENGQFTPAEFERFMRKWKRDGTASPALDMMLSTIRGGGVKLLNQYCAYGVATDADCDDCACECDISFWEALECSGAIIARDDFSITVESVLVTVGQYQVAIWSTDEAIGCCSQGIELITGTAPTTYCYNVTGETVSCAAFHHCGLYPNGSTEVNSILAAGAAPFTVKILIGEPCE